MVAGFHRAGCCCGGAGCQSTPCMQDNSTGYSCQHCDDPADDTATPEEFYLTQIAAITPCTDCFRWGFADPPTSYIKITDIDITGGCLYQCATDNCRWDSYFSTGGSSVGTADISGYSDAACTSHLWDATVDLEAQIKVTAGPTFHMTVMIWNGSSSAWNLWVFSHVWSPACCAQDHTGLTNDMATSGVCGNTATWPFGCSDLELQKAAYGGTLKLEQCDCP